MARLFTALENIDNNDSPDELNVLKARLTVYSNNREFKDNSKLYNLYKIESAISSGFTQLESMEKLYNTLESFKDTGIDSQTAQLLQVSVETIGMSLGNSNYITLPSFESTNNITANKIALETLGEKIKEFIIILWRTIKKYVYYSIIIIKSLYRALTDLYVNKFYYIEKKLDSLDPYHKGEPYYNSSIAKGFGLPTSEKIDVDTVMIFITDYNNAIYILSKLTSWYKQLYKNTKDHRDPNSFTNDDVFRYIYTVNETIHKIIDNKSKLFNGEIFIEGESFIINDEKLESLSTKSLWVGKEQLAMNIDIIPETNKDLSGLLKSIYDMRLKMVDKKTIDNVENFLSKTISENDNTLNKIKNNDKYTDEYRNVVIIMIKTLYMISFFTKTMINGYTDSINLAIKYIEISADRNEEPYMSD